MQLQVTTGALRSVSQSGSQQHPKLKRLLNTKRCTGHWCRNIDKAGGLDAYVWKIKGTKEDSEKAEQLRQLLKQHKDLARLEQQRQASLQQMKAARRLLPRAAAAVVEEQPTQ